MYKTSYYFISDRKQNPYPMATAYKSDEIKGVILETSGDKGLIHVEANIYNQAIKENLYRDVNELYQKYFHTDGEEVILNPPRPKKIYE